MTEEQYKQAVIDGWKACRKSVYAVCEDAQDTADTQYLYDRGVSYLAKSIARGFGAMEALDDDHVQAVLKLKGPGDSK